MECYQIIICTIIRVYSFSITFISENSAAFLYLFNMTLNGETFCRLYNKTSGCGSCSSEYSWISPVALIGADIVARWTPSIAGSHLEAARRGAEGARAEQRSTFKLLLSYRGFIAPIIKAARPPAFRPSAQPSALPLLPRVCDVLL